ncbi:hypothetical protein SAMN02745116_00366 [Pilibacter termitis]|uniref:PrgI family protein n=1 Tax=Pilibacter termitis TaxID=263852 RepID=A0A1T4KSQ8_9ENTE|nr:PrgI family protein [Pilibacter termitis]SJZ45441.1 hypothetical protein SAMN02745116_00366 [Pilibacter termitis]
MAISSEYYRDLSKVEKRIFKVTKRQFKGFLLLGVALIVGVAEVFLLPDWVYLLVSAPTVILLGTYPFLLILNKWKEFRRTIALYFIHEESFYQTYQIRRYEKHEFIAQKEVKEWT